jgi:hypothetical protein
VAPACRRLPRREATHGPPVGARLASAVAISRKNKQGPKTKTTIKGEIKVAWGLAPQVWPGALLAECRKRPAKARTKRAAQGTRFPFARVSLAQLGKNRWQKAGWPCCRHQGHSARRIAEAYDRGGRKYLGNRCSRLRLIPKQRGGFLGWWASVAVVSWGAGSQ